MRALLAWELGGNFGHIAHILDVAKNLSAKGTEIFFALKDPLAARKFGEDFDYKILPAPFKSPTPYFEEPFTYAEDLMGCGYGDPRNLEVLLKSWLDMIDLIKPDVLITQAAPTAQLAAKLREVKTVSMGSGYLVPPATTPLAPLCHWKNIPQNVLEEREALIINNVNTALEALNQKPIKKVTDIIKGDKEFLCTLPELDHYPEVSRNQVPHEYYGAFFKMDKGKKLAWKDGNYRRVFAYIQPQSHAFRECMGALSTLSPDHDIIVCAPNIRPEGIRHFAREGLRISNEIVRIDKLIDKCDLAVTHASQGVSSAFAVHGVPLVMVPNHIEQLMLAQKIASWDGGLVAQNPYNANGIFQQIMAIQQNQNITAATQKMAKKYKGYTPKKNTKKIADEIMSLVG